MILAVGLDNSYGMNFIQLKAIKAKKKKKDINPLREDLNVNGI